MSKTSVSRSDLFRRILSSEETTEVGSQTLPTKTYPMITKVTVRPNPFNTVLTIDVTCETNKNIIVRMFNEEGRIVKMFSWYLVKGTNVTTINELQHLQTGSFIVDIIDNEGVVLFTTKLNKE